MKSRTLTISWTDKASKRWLQSASTKINSITLTAYVRAVTWLNTTKRGSKSSFWKNRGVKIATQSCNQASQKTLHVKKENQATERILSNILWKSNQTMIVPFIVNHSGIKAIFKSKTSNLIECLHFFIFFFTNLYFTILTLNQIEKTKIAMFLKHMRKIS